MRFPSLRKIMAGSVISIISIIVLSGPANAGRITDYDEIPYWEYTYFQSMITYVSPNLDYINTTKRKIRIVEVEHKGKTLSTSMKDVHGDDIDITTLKAGKWIYVWGGVLGDHSIGAKDIIVLPGELTNTEMAEYPVLQMRKKFVYQHLH
jgi:hypothetical protein